MESNLKLRLQSLSAYENSLFMTNILHEQSHLDNFKLRSIVGVYINTMKTTFPFKFDFEQEFLISQVYIEIRNKEKVLIGSFSLCPCLYVYP